MFEPFLCRIGTRGAGFIAAIFYALCSTGFVVLFFGSHPAPRFMDVYLIGALLLTYFFSWGPALLLVVLALAVGSYILPPSGSFQVARSHDIYRLFSFSVANLVLMFVTEKLKSRIREAQIALIMTDTSARPEE